MSAPPEAPFPTRKYRLEGGEVTILDVPFVTQNPPSMYCVVAAMKMSWDYIRATKGSGKKPEDAPDLSFDSIRSLTRTDEYTGTILDDDLMSAFSASQGLVDATLLSGVSLQDMASRASRGLPAIALYYISVARDPTSETPGVGHACVYLGNTTLRVLVHNPWLGPYTQWPTNDFNWSRSRLADYAIVFDHKSRKVIQQRLSEQAAESNT